MKKILWSNTGSVFGLIPGLLLSASRTRPDLTCGLKKSPSHFSERGNPKTDSKHINHIFAIKINVVVFLLYFAWNKRIYDHKIISLKLNKSWSFFGGGGGVKYAFTLKKEISNTLFKKSSNPEKWVK